MYFFISTFCEKNIQNLYRHILQSQLCVSLKIRPDVRKYKYANPLWKCITDLI